MQATHYTKENINGWAGRKSDKQSFKGFGYTITLHFDLMSSGDITMQYSVYITLEILFWYKTGYNSSNSVRAK